MEVPSVKFADVGGLAIAWQQFGSGPDCLVIPPSVSNIEMQWEHEFYRRALEFQGHHMRVTHFDKRGIGLSDQFDGIPTVEERIGDVLAVMDAADLDSASIHGIAEGGLMAQLFAAEHPERVDRLVLTNSLAPGVSVPAEEAAKTRANLQRVAEDWGRDARFFVEWISPSQSTNESFVRWWGRVQRQSATQAEFIRQQQNVARLHALSPSFLDEVKAPTLVVSATGDQVVNPRCGDFLAERIPRAQQLRLDSDDHFSFIGDRWLEALRPIVEFLTGSPAVEPAERRFASVVFTDIVSSTTTSASLGDAAWRNVLDEHDRIAWSVSETHDGTVVKNTGDGVLARFDSPRAAIGFCTDIRTQLDQAGLRIRAGIHAGEIEVRANGDITGVAVNIAARVEECAPDGAVYVSSTVRDMLLGSATHFEDQGEHALKGFDHPWRLYELDA